MPQGHRGEIVVLAGTNGGGKSSEGGHHLRAAGGTYYNPDEVARKIREIRPELSQGVLRTLRRGSAASAS